MKSNYSTICNTKPSRLGAVKKIVAAFTAAGAVCKIDQPWHDDITITFDVGPHGCMMHLTKGSQVHSWLTHWYGDREYSNGFMQASGVYSRNAYHKMKCTGTYDDLDDMIRQTVAGIEHLKKELETFDRIEIFQDHEPEFGLRLPDTYQWRFKNDPGYIHGKFKSRAEAENDFCDWAADQYHQSNTMGLDTNR